MKALFDLADTEMADNLGGCIDDAARAQRVLDDAKADHALGFAIDHAKAVGGRDGLRWLRRSGQKIAAAEAEILAEHVRDDGNTRDAENLLADGKTSRREQRKKANRAKAVGKNKDLIDKLADGDLSEEQLDHLAEASNKTDGAAAVDDKLIDDIAAASPEQGKTIVDDYLAERASADGVQSEHDRQRALRRATKYTSKKHGLDTVLVEGDAVANKHMWDAIERRANEIYKRDGGRKLPTGEHPRTPDQRKFDAAYELICGETTIPNGQTTTATTVPAGASGASTRTSKRYTPAKSRPQIVIGLTVDKMLGHDPAAVAIQHGLGLIPDSVLANYAANADIIAALYDRNGEPLWLARLDRYANSTQMIALILRDRHCVLCGADHTRCQAHHTMPWNAPAKGRTDLDNLVLLCGPCHTRLHANNHTVYQDQRGHWQTRPATPDETPPPRPDTSRNTPRRE